MNRVKCVRVHARTAPDIAQIRPTADPVAKLMGALKWISSDGSGKSMEVVVSNERQANEFQIRSSDFGLEHLKCNPVCPTVCAFVPSYTRGQWMISTFPNHVHVALPVHASCCLLITLRTSIHCSMSARRGPTFGCLSVISCGG